jgi:hypothetical protein
MRAMQVPVLIDYATVPRRYRALLRKLQRSRWKRADYGGYCDVMQNLQSPDRCCNQRS